MENDKLRPLAIVGMSYRFPGQASSSKGFWDILSNAKSTATRVPENRFNPDSLHHPSPDRQGSILTTVGSFMEEDPWLFDAQFFSLTAAEVEGMDPQHRLVLEITYEAFENAGIDFRDLAGSQTACYVGDFSSDHLAVAGGEIYQQSTYLAAGSGRTMLANRVSWFFDLRGPSITIDTACSSSMVAVHEACQELQSGSSKIAVVAGTNLMTSPTMFRVLSAQRFLSPDGVCHSFDERANGYGRGEGVGVVIIKPLEDALKDGDIIRAVIRGSGCNQDGKTPAITVPSVEAQTALIRQTYESAGLELDKTTYFEAHGTGTAVGDPIELRSIGDTIGTARKDSGNPVFVGSVKSNIGHLEGAAGIAGVIKSVLLLEHGTIPAIAGFENANPRFQLDDWNVELPSALTLWPTPGLRRVSVNSFGYGGSNAHVILDDALHYLEERGLVGNHNTSATPALPGTPTSESSDSAVDMLLTASLEALPPQRNRLFVFSAPEQDGLARLAEAYRDFLIDKSAPENQKSLVENNDYLADLAYTLAERRTMFDFRSFAVAGSTSTLQAVLDEPGLPKLGRVSKTPSAAFVFTGQGAQWHAMGRELNSYPMYAASIRAADEYITSLGSSWSVVAELGKNKESSRINEPELSQPLCTVVQMAMVDLLTQWGISPKAVVGHSSGEIAAAYAAGILTREDAWAAAYWRGLRSSQITNLAPERTGAMMAAAISASAAQEYLDRVEGDIVVACINSPNSVTISGDTSAVSEVEALLHADEIWCRKLMVNTAYHSPHMKVIADQYLEDIKHIQPQESASGVTMFSSVTGKAITSGELGAEYWVRNLLNPVRFSEAVTSLLEPADSRSRRKGMASVEILLELGPHAALQGPLRETLAAASDMYVAMVSYTSMLQRGCDATDTALAAAGRLWSRGVNVDLSIINGIDSQATPVHPMVDLPRYPFNHKKRYCSDTRCINWSHNNGQPRSDLLGAPTRDSNSVSPTWKNYLTPGEVPYLLDHKMLNTLILPGAVYIVMAMEACLRSADKNESVEGFEFRDIVWHKAIVFESPDAVVETITQLMPHALGTKVPVSDWTHFSVNTIDDKHEASLNCSGLVRIKYVTPPSKFEDDKEKKLEWAAFKAKYEEYQSKPTIDVPVENEYNKLHDQGMGWGPTFRNIVGIHVGEGWGYADLMTPDTAALMPEGYEYPVPFHPTMIDAAFQMLAFLDRSVKPGDAMLPSMIESLYISNTAPTEVGTMFKATVVCDDRNSFKSTGSIVMTDEAWEKPVMIMKHFVAASAGPSPSGPKTSFARLDWKLDTRLSPIPTLDNRSASDVAAAQSLDAAAAKFIKQASGLKETSSSENITLRNYARMLAAIQGDAQPAVSDYAIQEVGEKLAEISFQGNAEPVESDAKNPDAIHTVGDKLADILTDFSVAGKLLTGELLSNFAEQTMDRSFSRAMVVDILERATFLNPGLEVLEIGGGYASTNASAVFERLGAKSGRLTKYTLTAHEAEALEAAAKTLTAGSVLNSTKPLDISASIKSQGFDEGVYDYVILDDVLLSVSNIAVALINIKKLLKPNGKLIIVALTQYQLRTAFVLGATDRWWRNNSSDATSDRLNESAWSQLLIQSGFSGVEQTFVDSEDQRTHQLSVMISSLQQNKEYLMTDVLLLHPETKSKETSRLMANCADSLAKLGLNSTEMPWNAASELPADISDKFIISFMEFDAAILHAMSKEEFDGMRNLSVNCGAMLWITRSGLISGTIEPTFSAGVGFFRVIRAEGENRRLLTLDLSQKLDPSKEVEIVMKVFSLFSQSGDLTSADSEYAEDNGALYVQRLVEDPGLNAAEVAESDKAQPEKDRLFQDNRKLMLTIGPSRSIESLYYVDRVDFKNVALPPDAVEIKVMCTGLNFLDLMATLGEVPELQLGNEMAGTISEVGSDVKGFKVGDAVAGLARGSFASHCIAKASMVKHIPANLTPEEAASIPTCFQTAWISLVVKARIKKGESILIHAGAGGVGQAAIQVAQLFGLEIYTTVGTDGKKELLMERYGIPEDHIFYSRDASFAKGIRRMTNGLGVDVVLNSLAGELLRESWHLLRDFGRFVEMGKRDILANAGLDMEPFLRSVSFIGINLLQYHPGNPGFEENEDSLTEVFRLMATGALRPIYPVTVYDYNDIGKALRLLQSGKAMGKIVMKAEPDQIVPVLPRTKHPLELDPNATYVLSGGLGGIGRSLTLLMFEHGARNFAYLSRSGDSKEKSKIFLDQVRAAKCTANTYACDIADKGQVATTIEKISSEMPPIKGLIQCAMVLKDSVFENMTYDDWAICTRPKIQGTWYLHEHLPKDMDFFIMLASISGVMGNPGQANYATGNTFQDALALHRHRLGMKATSLDLGPVRDVGYITESGDRNQWANSPIGQLMITNADIHFLVTKAMTGYSIGDDEVPTQVVYGLMGANIDERVLSNTRWMRDGKLSIAFKSSTIKSTTVAGADIQALLRAGTVSVAAGMVADVMVKRIATALMLPEEDISVTEPLQTYGLNSLVAVEMRTWLSKEFQCDISIKEISPSAISTLSFKIVRGSRLLKGKLQDDAEAAAS